MFLDISFTILSKVQPNMQRRNLGIAGMERALQQEDNRVRRIESPIRTALLQSPSRALGSPRSPKRSTRWTSRQYWKCKRDDFLTVSKTFEGTGSVSVRASNSLRSMATRLGDGGWSAYFEVLIKQFNQYKSATSFVNIGLTGEANFQFFGNPVGRLPGSFAVDSNGCYWASNIQMEGFVPGGYGRCDRIGCGMTKRNGRWHILFTKNGQLIGEPILLAKDDGAKAVDDEQLLQLFPTVSTSDQGQTMFEANFGGKPFRFDLDSLRI